MQNTRKRKTAEGNAPLKTGDTVRYSKPFKGEEQYRFRVVAVNDDRVDIELVCGWFIAPIETVELSEVTKEVR